MSRAMLGQLALKAFMSVQSKVQALIEDDPDRAIWEAENTEKADCRLQDTPLIVPQGRS